ncbi:Stk1 family PASTA domain-containing Ser/Thr kinase [Tissierella sp. Yu-01]|uniref:Stk1 family PASTA domain-containing Ser/Thr kinase n=1 Tax=Tissierella sp. Yu-01 TaxID=3035694 RepID=UPI00240DF00B|nr:Stk1 family PASTA domain-containing Ser/Thr kinase [Tissierella sp. Yu-01]WFA09810.1 Stk1 family PASTA domain-containing Ser/Thr kinase [Tissierella sp. Yu-01]
MIGIILGNRYEIIEKIGEGGMAIVYKAKCHLLNRFVAIKVLRDEFTDDEQFIGKFRRESQAAASLSHPNIMNIYDVGAEEIDSKKIHYIVMEYINGYTLKEIIRSKGKLTAEETIKYSLQMAEALQHAHRNSIVHRDIKPHNIMITDDNRIKVTDFGIARAVTSSTVTTTSNVLGSVHYFSPEQARGGYTDEKSDIYSLGIVMYEMITGKVPYDGESPISVALKHIQEEIVLPSQIDNTVPANLESIIMKCVQKRQSDRYGNITELISDLKGIKSNDIKSLSDNDIESATRIIPAIEIKEDDIVESKTEKRKKKSVSKNKKKNRKESGGGVVFLGILLAFVLVTSLFLGYAKLKELLAVDEIPVPYIVGMQEDEARAKIEELNLAFNVTDRVKNDEFEAGEVIYQSVEADTMVKSGYPINVTISEGPDLVSVPLIKNKTLDEAEEILNDSGLMIGTRDPGFSDTVPKGSIISQDPEPLTEVEPGSRVNIVISEGPEIVNVVMPSVVNKTIEEARKAIVAEGLIVGDVTPQPSNNVEKDLVTWQSYEPGTTLESGTTVDLYISSGPDGTTEPGNRPGEIDGEVPTPITLTPSPDKEETEIKIIRLQDGVTDTVFNEVRKLSDGAFTITLYGKVGARYDIFYDDIFQAPIYSVAP